MIYDMCELGLGDREYIGNNFTWEMCDEQYAFSMYDGYKEDEYVRLNSGR